MSDEMIDDLSNLKNYIDNYVNFDTVVEDEIVKKPKPVNKAEIKESATLLKSFFVLISFLGFSAFVDMILSLVISFIFSSEGEFIALDTFRFFMIILFIPICGMIFSFFNRDNTFVAKK
jgi:hypothetical protein